MPATALERFIWGQGQRVVLVHGSIANGPLAWSDQQPLADRWRLEVPNRRGYGNSPPPTVRSDFEEDAEDIAELLDDGAHLVGHSYGAIVALYAAALRPQSVRSLVICEPPAFSLLKGDPRADAIMSAHHALPRDAGPRKFFEAFAKATYGQPLPTLPPGELPPALEQGMQITMAQRPAGDAAIPLDALKRISCRKLIISGDHSPVFESICDLLQRELNAERFTIRGAGHTVQRVGGIFNQKLNEFLGSE